MDIKKFREVIARREYAEKISQGEWYDEIAMCNKLETNILSEDIPSTIDFLRNDCTPDEYSWISEVIDDIAEKTNSRELVDCYKNLMSKFPEECEKYNIAGSIESADEILDWRKSLKQSSA